MLTDRQRIGRLEHEIALLRAVVKAVRNEDHAIALVQRHMAGIGDLDREGRRKKKRGFQAFMDQWEAAERDKEDALAALAEFDEKSTA